MNFYETYESEKFLYLFMEYFSGGDINETIINEKKKFSEDEARNIMSQLFYAINHSHHTGYVHRDLKLENIMFKDENKQEVAIIDFGLGKYNPIGQHKLESCVGTPYFLAYEVMQGDYGNECDCWSLGIIMFGLLSGCLPFVGKDQQEVFDKIESSNLEFKQKIWAAISDEAKDLIKNLVTKDVKKRLSCAKALKHPWFKNGGDVPLLCGTYEDLDKETLQRLVAFKPVNVLKMEALVMMTKMIPNRELARFKH